MPRNVKQKHTAAKSEHSIKFDAPDRESENKTGRVYRKTSYAPTKLTASLEELTSSESADRRSIPTLENNQEDEKDPLNMTAQKMYEFFASKNRVMSNFIHPALPAVPLSDLRDSQ